MSFLGDVEIAVTGSASGSALYTTYRYDYSTQAGICPVISLGADEGRNAEFFRLWHK